MAYRWELDGVPVGEGTMEIPGGAEGTTDYAWPWDFARHRLKLTINPDDLIDEEEEQNDTLSIYTDAIALGLWVEQGAYAHFRRYQAVLPGAHSTSFEDWAQRHVRRLNAMFAQAIYPETADGVLDRVRLEKIVVVADGSIASQYLPDEMDRTVDLQWGIKDSQTDFFGRPNIAQDWNPFYYYGAMLHELGHERSLIDVYAFRVFDGLPGNSVDITVDGVRVANTPYFPATPIIFNDQPGFVLFETSDQGLMNTDYTRIDRYSAAALNLMAGQRATPNSEWSLLNYLPSQNVLQVLDQDGAPVANAEVWVYQAEAPPSSPAGFEYSRVFDGVPELQLTTDADGRVLLGTNPFRTTGPVDATHMVAIVRVTHGDRVGFGVIEARVWNLSYWAGEHDLAQHELTVTLLQRPGAP